ncbi:Do family serine endopeptidase [Mesoterricola sediminis]|uniref:Peptidase n=1 Tax=Mesoterricola sediminis TaxID=2927980 RepID=A0AA48H732_9BACT|nr:Do family serine endopeptidase [Mesoterricola sediminis]BDU78571.1 peptidase [Mesoterricola sediminis]
MKRHIKQLFMLSAFAGACMAVGMGLSYHWVAKAQEEQPVTVDAKGLDRLPPIAEVADKLNPTVVSITNTSFVKTRGRGGENPFGDDFFNWFFGPQRPGQRAPQEEEQRVQGAGSGVIISPDGEILTNNHVIDGVRGSDTQIEVKTSDGRSFKATILGKDKELDIALIKIDAKHLPYAKLGDSDAMRIGEWVVAIGNPLGLEHTVTQGIISAKGRQLTGPGLESFIQTDAAINRGNSGGPLLNLRGEVIGINTAIRPDGQNIGFAVPVNMIKRIIPDLKSGKPVSRGYLGVGTRPMDAEFQSSLGIKEGAVVSNVDRGTPADKAGIQRLDVITGVDGQKIRSGDELVAAIAGRRAGESVTVTVWREGKFKDIKVVLGDRRDLQKGDADEEESAPAPENDSKGGEKTLNLEKSYGFTVEALSPANRHQFGIPNDVKGVVVTYVATRSGAADKGLAPGLVITAVGPRDVEDLAQFNAEVKKAGGKKPLLLLVKAHRGGAITLAIPPR